MTRFIISLLLLLSASNQCRASSEGPKIVRFASPLQSLTIWDKRDRDGNARSQFLPKYKVGLKAEVEARKKIESERGQNFESDGSNWADKAAAAERIRSKNEDRIVEDAFDEATKAVESSVKAISSDEKGSSQYQFVGVIKSGEKPITWYARKKPTDAKWSVRLVHANRDAIIKDMFNKGKVDIFAKYSNTGQINEETKQRVVTRKYDVKERSWRTLWNFSPKRFFTDSSGMYWRERRLTPGLYTDGNTVYESSYRYSDGRNGLHRVSTFDQFLKSKSVDSSKKQAILKKLENDSPDVVLEE